MKKSCPLCSSDKNIKCISNSTREDKGKVHKCKTCGHVFLDLGIDPDQYEDYFNSYYENDTQRKEYIESKDDYIAKIKNDNIRRLDVCKDYLNGTFNVLDFGAGYCLFSYLVKPFVSSVIAVDKSKLTKENANKFGIDYISDIHGINPSEKKFDAIFAFHTLEHLIEPGKTIKHLSDLLTDNGLLFIEVPNQNDLLVKLSKKYRAFYYQVAHLHYFKRKTLFKLIANGELTLLKRISTQRYGFSNHLRWIFNIKTNRETSKYRRILSGTVWADTLFYVFQKQKNQRKKP
ncbi:class I SAM-dependent methyltransferase [Bacteroidota bacterium]